MREVARECVRRKQPRCHVQNCLVRGGVGRSKKEGKNNVCEDQFSLRHQGAKIQLEEG